MTETKSRFVISNPAARYGGPGSCPVKMTPTGSGAEARFAIESETMAIRAIAIANIMMIRNLILLGPLIPSCVRVGKRTPSGWW
jgi:hypothetical protein